MYMPVPMRFVEQGRELAVTVGGTGQRSNQLNYVPNRGINNLA